MAMRFVCSCPFFLLLAVIYSQEHRWRTTDELNLEAFSFTSVVCPNATPIVAIHSTYIINSDHFGDRQWKFRCVLPSDDFVFQWGAWSNEITHLDQDFTLICPPDTFVGGVVARFFNTGDSLWDILCNQLPEGYELGDCSNWTVRMNQIYGNLTFPTLRQGWVIGGVRSVFDRHLDRYWRYKVCLIKDVSCLVPTIPQQRRHRDRWTSGSPGPRRISWNNSLPFSCRRGFFLLGPQVATCTINGTWTELPSCKACPTIPHCAKVVCTAPDHVHCLHCVSYHISSGLPLQLSKDRKRCEDTEGSNDCLFSCLDHKVTCLSAAPPVIHPVARTIIFTPGDTIVVHCQAWGHPKPNVSWYQEWEEVGEDGRVQQNNGSLVITNATFADEGWFHCLATNTAGEDVINITLFTATERLLKLPTIINWTKFHSFATGSTALVTCEATGHPPPTITWSRSHRKRSVPIPTQFNLRVHQFRNGTLGFFPAYEADSGTYTCIATNQAGSWYNQTVVFVSDPSGEIHGGSITLPEASGVVPESASGSAPLASASGNVEPASSGELPSTPDIVDWVDEYTVVVGTTLELPCHATGFPLPQVNWISRSIEVGREGEAEGVRVYPNGSLVISHIGGHHLQVYKCVAWNIHGITYRAVAVTIATGPDVSNFSAHVTTSVVPTRSSTVTATPSVVPTSSPIIIMADCSIINCPPSLLIFLMFIVCITHF